MSKYQSSFQSPGIMPCWLPKAFPPLNRDTWVFTSRRLPRPQVCDILNIIDVGASIGHLGPQKPQSCKNLKSATDHSAVISKEIDSLLSEGCIHGPFMQPPLPNFRCLPLGTSTHKHNPKRCVFNHYSWPITGSVNDETPDTEGTIHYDSFASAATMLCDSG